LTERVEGVLKKKKRQRESCLSIKTNKQAHGIVEIKWLNTIYVMLEV